MSKRSTGGYKLKKGWKWSALLCGDDDVDATRNHGSYTAVIHVVPGAKKYWLRVWNSLGGSGEASDDYFETAREAMDAGDRKMGVDTDVDDLVANVNKLLK